MGTVYRETYIKPPLADGEKPSVKTRKKEGD